MMTSAVATIIQATSPLFGTGAEAAGAAAEAPEAAASAPEAAGAAVAAGAAAEAASDAACAYALPLVTRASRLNRNARRSLFMVLFLSGLKGRPCRSRRCGCGPLARASRR